MVKFSYAFQRWFDFSLKKLFRNLEQVSDVVIFKFKRPL